MWERSGSFMIISIFLTSFASFHYLIMSLTIMGPKRPCQTTFLTKALVPMCDPQKVHVDTSQYLSSFAIELCILAMAQIFLICTVLLCEIHIPCPLSHSFTFLILAWLEGSQQTCDDGFPPIFPCDVM